MSIGIRTHWACFISLDGSGLTLPAESMQSLSTHQEKGIVSCIALMAFVFQFDAVLVTVSLPDMQRELGTTTTGVTWVLLSYLLAAIVALIPAGHLCDRFSLRTMSLSGAALATVGTLMCGLASSLDWLCIGRLLQGLGMGTMVAAGYAMMPTWVRPARMGWGYGMQSLGAGLGMMTGAPAGGFLSHSLTWQWLFLGSIPFFFMLAVLIYVVIPPGSQQILNKTKSIAWSAILSFCVLLSVLVLLLTWGVELGIGSPVTQAMLLSFVALITLSRQLAKRGKLVFSSGLFDDTSRLAGLGCLFLFAALVNGIRFTMPFYLELACLFGIILSSMLMLCFPLGYSPMGVWSGSLSDRLGSRRVMMVAAMTGWVACMLFASISHWHHPWIAGAFILVFGIAAGLFFPPTNRLIMSQLPDHLHGEAGGLLTVVFNLGGLIGTAAFHLVLNTQGDVYRLSFLVAGGLCAATGMVIMTLPRQSR